VPLEQLRPGQCGVLVHDGDPAVARRLLELGLVPGTEVRMIRRAPLGDPVEVELRGYRLCVRRADLAGLRVRLDGGAS
jgi:Fe2+ transport system protein FeoA